MIIFEHEKFLRNIRKNGITASDRDAKFKIVYLIQDLLCHTSYRKNKIIEIAKAVSKGYFDGLPDELVTKTLEAFYDEAKSQSEDQDINECHGDKKIILYESEMRVIESLRKDDKLMRLAFATMVLFKHSAQFIVDGTEKYYKTAKTCDPDIYRIAQLDNVSGTTKAKMWKKLSDMGLVKFQVRTNQSWKFYPKWIAMQVFTVPFCVELQESESDEAVYKQVTNYDDVLLYLRHWMGDPNIIECADCGCPILKTANSKCICSNCAIARKKVSDKNRYSMKKVI